MTIIPSIIEYGSIDQSATLFQPTSCRRAMLRGTIILCSRCVWQGRPGQISNLPSMSTVMPVDAASFPVWETSRGLRCHRLPVKLFKQSNGKLYHKNHTTLCEIRSPFQLISVLITEVTEPIQGQMKFVEPRTCCWHLPYKDGLGCAESRGLICGVIMRVCYQRDLARSRESICLDSVA